MLFKIASIAVVSFFGVTAAYMYSENQALGVYGVNKGYGRDCVFMDVYLNLHEQHIGGKKGSFGIHGCPIFKQM